MLASQNLGDANSLLRREFPRVACTKQRLTRITTNFTCFPVFQHDASHFSHSQQDFLFFFSRVAQEYPEAIVGMINRLEESDVDIVSRKDDSIAN